MLRSPAGSAEKPRWISIAPASTVGRRSAPGKAKSSRRSSKRSGRVSPGASVDGLEALQLEDRAGDGGDGVADEEEDVVAPGRGPVLVTVVSTVTGPVPVTTGSVRVKAV